MIYGIYSIKDELNGFTNVFLDRNDETAERGFINAMQTEKGYAMIKKDLSLWCLGTFDTEKGIVIAEEKKIIDGGSVSESVQNQA